MRRTAFFLSDGTGITAETLGNSLLTQFEGVQIERVTIPYVDNPDKAELAVARINTAAERDGAPPLVFDTIVKQDIRNKIMASRAVFFDVFDTFLKPLEQQLGISSSYTSGKCHSINEFSTYHRRIESVNFALDNDDGGRQQDYGKADIILIGVSRCGKTPTCLYMALQFGIRAANYPLTQEDLDRPGLPDILLRHRHKLYGLTIDPFQLASIRHERRNNSRYASLDQCEWEVDEVERRFREFGITSINTTHFSIEEIATRIMDDVGLVRGVA
ncbi:kinase/pyrophosphorylase [Natronospirillum operosum]|uniref:Putative phosphoenolpyruvate synthase regulatory protein n=1 Tax=Natronospirillum operosum TaxID=2759953 RepID=A0A4Z0WAQ2_9GAMM|nr:pyruvate, water dikinase regulatory protein [Natronospirillum operosum]TGG95729.1 kinase/pyrophosphorylase [Natronospirillum operosum]